MSQPQRLPGMEDSAVEELEDAAREYATIRDERQKLTLHESELKAKLLRLMKDGKRSLYERDGVKIELVVEEETVKVRVKKEREEGDRPASSSVTTVRPVTPDETPEPLCRLCQAPNPEFQTTDGKFFYCEIHSSNVQEGEKVKRIRDRQKAEAIAQTMREPGDESENEAPREDPLLSPSAQAEESAFINQRNKGRRKRAAK